MARIVIADTSPLRYLVAIGQGDLLPALYGEVLIPEIVADELSHASTPEPVRQWIAEPPSWLRVIPRAVGTPSVTLPDLDAGERAAILLALDFKADLLLMDERDGVEESRRLGLAVTGTLGVVDRGAERGLIELGPAIARLRRTNFRIDPALLDKVLAADAQRIRKPC